MSWTLDSQSSAFGLPQAVLDLDSFVIFTSLKLISVRIMTGAFLPSLRKWDAFIVHIVVLTLTSFSSSTSSRCPRVQASHCILNQVIVAVALRFMLPFVVTIEVEKKSNVYEAVFLYHHHGGVY